MRYWPVLVDALKALAYLSQLNERVFAFQRESGVSIAESPEGDWALLTLSDQILSPLRALEERLEAGEEPEPNVVEMGSIDVNFRVDEPETSDGTTGGFDSDDIFVALDTLQPKSEISAAERKSSVDKALAAFGFGLGRQLKDFDDRFTQTLCDKQLSKALQELDDTVDVFIDGLFALVAAIAEPYLGSFDRAKLLPGHRTSLDTLLLVRAGIAKLRQTINQHNTVLQNNAAHLQEREQSLAQLRTALNTFLKGEVFQAMRAADRYELESVAREIESLSVKAAAQPCEGLAKYLDSLVMMNERDSVLQHDKETLKSAADLLEASHSVVGVSMVNAQKLLRDAMGVLDRLYGMREDLDNALLSWRGSPPDLSSEDQIITFIDRLYDAEPRLNPIFWFEEATSSSGRV